MLRFIRVRFLACITTGQLRKPTDRIARRDPFSLSPVRSQVLMVLMIRRNNIQVVFLRSYLCPGFLADGVRNEISTQVRVLSLADVFIRLTPCH